MHQNIAFLLSSSQLPAVKKATFWFIPIPKQILGPSYFASAFFRPKTKVWSPNSLVSCSIMYPSCYTYLWYVFTCISPQIVFNLNKSWEKKVFCWYWFFFRKHLLISFKHSVSSHYHSLIAALIKSPWWKMLSLLCLYNVKKLVKIQYVISTMVKWNHKVSFHHSRLLHTAIWRVFFRF